MSAAADGFSAAYAAPAKLNLMLRVTGRRADGYHLLQTVFRFIDRADTLRFRVRADGVIARVSDIVGVPAESDLCVRAARALQTAGGTRLGADIRLDKKLPMGGGLGGGSSDAATTLMALNALWRTGLTRPQLMVLGEQLGADVPVFVFGENAVGEGIGEALRALELPPAWYLVLTPPVAVPTADVFARPELKRDSKKVTIQSFSGFTLSNDLEPVVTALYPEVARHLAWLKSQGCGDAMMTGSGACVFAAFESEATAYQVAQRLPSGMSGFVAQGLPRHPLQELL